MLTKEFLDKVLIIILIIYFDFFPPPPPHVYVRIFFYSSLHMYFTDLKFKGSSSHEIINVFMM